VDWPTFVWMFLVLKIPIVAALWLIWWAVTSEPEPATEEDQGGGGGRHPRPRPRKPLGPRRGDHPLPRPPAPQRVRARGKKLSRSGG
jgi:hypothetical protein